MADESAKSDVKIDIGADVKPTEGVFDRLKRRFNSFGESAQKALRFVSTAIDKMNPSAKTFTGEVGKWVQKIPGVSSMMKTMPGAAGAIAVAFKATTAAVMMAIKAMREFREMKRSAAERDITVSGENITNQRTNAIAALDLRENKRKAELESQKELIKAEYELSAKQEEARKYEKLATTSNPLQRQFIELESQRKLEMERMSLREKMIEEDEKNNDAERAANDERLQIVDEQIAAEKKRLEKMEELREQYAEYKSERMELAKRRLKEQGVEEGSEGWLASLDKFVGEDLKAWAKDKLVDKTAEFGLGDMTTEQGRQKLEAKEDEIRRERQSIKQLEKERAELAEQQEENDRQRKRIEADRRKFVADDDVRVSRIKSEDRARQIEKDNTIAGKRLEAMGAPNRLTQMGLGGGNAGLDTGRDIANNTKQMVALQKETLRAFNRRRLTDSHSMNGPSMTARASIGDWGAIWSM